jgi:hypothetical protein
MLYALGEIALVVIGILIALQINNWNESRKENLQETTILKQLQTEFKSNLKQLDEKNALKRDAIHSSLELFRYIDFPNLRNRDSINYHLARTIPYTTFDPIVNDLASSGDLRIIKNNELKKMLSFWTSEILDVREEELNWKEYRDNKYVPFIIKYYQLRSIRNLANKNNVLGKYLMENKTTSKRPELGDSRHPEDFNLLLDHPDYEDHLERCLTKNTHSLNQSTILRKSIIEILELLDLEMKND